jgi:hypothetical protein
VWAGHAQHSKKLHFQIVYFLNDWVLMQKIVRRKENLLLSLAGAFAKLVL